MRFCLVILQTKDDGTGLTRLVIVRQPLSCEGRALPMPIFKAMCAPPWMHGLTWLLWVQETTTLGRVRGDVDSGTPLSDRH